MSEENVTHYVSATLNFGLFLLTIEDEDREKFLIDVIRKLGQYQYKYENNENFQLFFKSCWKLCGMYLIP